MVVKGKKLTQKEYWQKLKDELKDMTFREKLEHLWEYYKWILGVFLGVVFVICAIIASIITLNTQIRLAGVLINVDVSLDGYVYLQNGYFERIGGQKGKEIVDLRSMQFENPYTTVDQTFALNVQESVVALISARELDYLMFDDTALPFFMDPETLMDLREMFTQEELDALGTAVIKLQLPETGEVIPMAIDVSDTAVFREYMDPDKPVYLAFSIVTPRMEACADFWQFLKGGQTDVMETMLAGTAVDAKLTEAREKLLTEDFFAAQGYTVGDHRVDLTQQSIKTEDAETNKLVREDVLAQLASGSLDYVLCTDKTLLEQAQLLDLSQILTEQELEDYDIVYRDEIPVAVALKAVTEDTAYLAFSANTNHLQTMKDLWNYIQTVK